MLRLTVGHGTDRRVGSVGEANLAYGTWLRSQGRDSESGAFLEMARAEFDRIGALPWADEARSELARAGR